MVKGAGAPAEPAHRPLTLFNTLITVLKNTAAAPSFQQSFTGRKGVKTLNTDLCDVVKLLTFERRSDLRDRYNLVEPSRLADPSDIEIKLRRVGQRHRVECHPGVRRTNPVDVIQLQRVPNVSGQRDRRNNVQIGRAHV